MSYQKNNNTILIARQGYGGLGATGGAAAASYCGTKFGVQSKDFQPCVDHYNAGKPGDYIPSQAASGSSGTLSQIGGFFSDLLKGAVNSFATAKGGSSGGGGVILPPPSSTPSWVMPVAIGGLGLAALLILRKRSAGPTTNPARRRRRKRR